MTNKHEICRALRKMAKTFNRAQQPTDDAIETYAEILQEFTPEQIMVALKKIILKGSPFYPSCGEIVVEINGKQEQLTGDEQADVMAGEIVKAIRQFGFYQAREAKEHLGETCWRGVEYMGGWQALCNSDTDDLGMIRAQLRRATKSSKLVEESPGVAKLLGIKAPIQVGTLLENN